MLRKSAIDRNVGFEHGFRWRGTDPNRFEGFSDAVFGFAITLLVVSLEVPQTFSDLLESMRGFVGFAACFAILVWVWYQQYLFFRRYGLEDGVTIVLNSVLLFLVLFYIYPLKFLSSFLLRLATGGGVMIQTRSGETLPILQRNESAWLMLIYSAGFIAVFLVFALMFRHAYKLRDALNLNEIERYDTRTLIQSSLINVVIGLLSITIVVATGLRQPAYGGLVYFLIGPSLGIHGYLRGKRRPVFDAPAAAEGQAAAAT